MAGKHTITIGFDQAAGKFTYDCPGASDPTELEVKPKDQIWWTADEPFAVLFAGSDSPCEEEGRSGGMMVGSAQAGKKLKTKVKEKGPKGGGKGPNEVRYKYWVAMNVGGDVKTDDPAILVRF